MEEDTETDPVTALLNGFPVPMFALERATLRAPFRFVSFNEAMQRNHRRPATELLGRTPREVMCEREATIAERAYAACARRRDVVRFRDVFTTAGRPVVWDTTLQYVPLPDGQERILGTATTLSDAPAPDRAGAFDDIRFFASVADYQLQNLISLFDDLRGEGLLPPEQVQRAERVGAMCRAVQRAVTDIRDTVARAQDGIATPSARPPARRARSATVAALVNH